MSSTVPDAGTVPTQQASPDAVPAAATPSPATSASPPPSEDRTQVVRDAVLAGGCALSGVLITVGFALDPASSASDAADIVAAAAADPGRFYAANTLGAFGLVMLALGGFAVIRLVRQRGRALATAGGLLTAFGGTAAGAGIFMYGAAVTVAVQGPLGTEQAVAFQDHAGDSAYTGLPFVLGFPTLMLGLLLCAIALFRAADIPKAAPALLGLGLIGIFVLPDDSAASVVPDVLLASSLVVLGALVWMRRAHEPRTIALPE